MFIEALDKQEAKEKADLEVSIKNAMKKFAKDEPKGKKKNLGVVAVSRERGRRIDMSLIIGSLPIEGCNQSGTID